MRRERAVLALILVTAAALRLGVIAAIPHDFGPGDPAIYRAMARGLAEHGSPRIGFVWHWLTRPPAVLHAEDYYEPAFAALLVPVAWAGGGAAAMALVPLLFSLAGVWLAWRIARRVGPRTALAAAALVALDPWSVYMGGVVMKESLVALLVAGVALAFEAALDPRRGHARAGAMAGFAAAAAGMFQYELLPVALAAMGVTLARHRRSALPAALLAAGVVVAGAAAWSWIGLGVPLSAKAGFFLGERLWTPEPAPDRRFDLGRFLPLGYAVRRVFETGQPALLLLAGLGLTTAAVSAGLRTAALALFAAWLWAHGVPLDLWERDFVPLAPLAFALAAIGLARLAAMPRAGAAGWAAAAAVLAVAPWLADRLARKLHLDWANSHTWPALAITAILLLAAVPLGRSLGARAGERAPAAFAALALGALLAAAQIVLPLPRVYANPQFPDHARALAAHVRVSGWLHARPLAGPLLARAPWDLAEHSGHPVVNLPEPPTRAALALAREAWSPRWMLLDSLDVAAGVARRTPAREAARFEGFTLYELTVRPASR